MEPDSIQPAGQQPEPGRLGRVPWTLVEAILLLFGAYLMVWTWAGVRLLLSDRGLVGQEVLAQLALPVGFVVMGLFPVVWVGTRHREGLRRLFGRLERPTRTLAAGLALGAGVFLVTRLALALLLVLAGGGELPDLPQVQEDYRDMAQDPLLAGWFLITVVLLAPAVEEILFRGLIFQSLRDLLGLWPGIGVSSLVFTALHLNPEGGLDANLLVFVMIFPLAMFLAWLFQRQGSLIVPIAVHGSYNLVGFLLFRLGG